MSSFMRMAGPPVTTLPSGTFFSESSAFFPHRSILNPIIKPEPVVKAEVKPEPNQYNLRHSNNNSPTKPTERIYKHEIPQLPECPVFYPTEEEFVNPMKYLDSIRDIGHQYGIAKIVPPSKKWLNGKPFEKIIDYNNYLFPTKIQNIHQLQHRNGPYAKFMQDLEEFLEQKRQPLKSPPFIDGQELDLFHLYRVVTFRGGYHKVNNQKLWKEVAQDLRMAHANLATLKQYYVRYLLSYEDFQMSQGVTLPEYIYDYAPSAGTFTSNVTKKCEDDSNEEDMDSEEEFGYYDGKMFTLHQYRRMADQFKHRFFPEGTEATSQEIEKLYWNIVQSAEECVKVHYGSDVEVSTYGSGFPSSDLDKASGWNLNKFATFPGSLLNFLNEQVSGVTIPMMYIGMLFSTFCWHTEDNYLYSINYNHYGAAKHWYGIPAYAAEAFEKVMKEAVPELFLNEPNLLFQLVTMIPPKLLVDNNVPVYTCVQNAGDIMITFPKGYHAGFSEGFNVAESTNFALDDWWSWGKECCERYRHYSRSSVLSIEKLLCNASQSEYWKFTGNLKEEIINMRSKELFLREKVYKEGIWKSCKFEKYEDVENMFECCICKYDCYLSAIVCPCSPKNILCLRHSDKNCGCPVSRKFLLFKYKMSEIEEFCKRVGATNEDFENTMVENSRKFNVEKQIGKGMKGVCKNSRFSRLIGVTKPVVRKLARKAGIKRLEKVCYSNNSSPPQETIQNNNEEVVIIETILQSRINHGRQEYLIKWEGSDATWEKASELCCPSLIEAFKNNFKETKTTATTSTAKPTQLRRSRRMGRGSHV